MKHRVFLKRDNDMFLIFAPSIRTYSEAHTTNLVEARDAAKSVLEDWKKTHGYLPESLSVEECYRIAEEDADDIFDFRDGALMQIEVE